uniref:BCL7-like protein n=1 Tax=Globodera rostochiensis TaxID=31243 RepID=A0A914HU77_GLORO
MQNTSRSSTLPKTIPRSNRAETRSRAKDELRKVIGAVDKTVVRKWEKRWVMLKDSSISVWKWVPVSCPPGGVVAPKLVAPKAPAVTDENCAVGTGEAAADETTMQSGASGENNSNEDAADVNMTMLNTGEEEEDSNTALDFSDVGAFDSDSQTFDQIDYNNKRVVDGAAEAGKGQPTDFSQMRKDEAKGGATAKANMASTESQRAETNKMYQLQ